MRILVVDVYKSKVDQIAGLLDDHFLVDCLYTQRDLLAKIYSFKPDVVVLGLHLHGMDGRYFCSLLKTLPATKHIGIVILCPGTDHCQLMDEEWCADAFLYEPIIPADLVQAVRQLHVAQSKRHS